ncbi:tetratricopeptide repeat protein [candidate division CSSED10-310 bacterium]|uniref:Tetratricopeptide repeat protein n=1 Tax=candidate division CSSED10-310 bacterium TaxID=2855610 RepID=A0ABV6YUZ5_UNCC1
MSLTAEKIILTLCGLIMAWFLFSTSLLGYHLNPDGILYFTYLRSAFFDHDFLFVNEFNTLRLLHLTRYVTATGLEGNHVAIGTPLLMSPFYALASIIVRAAGFFGKNLGTHGYYGLFSYVFPFGALFYGILTLILMHKIVSNIVKSKWTHRALFHIAFGTPLFFYVTIHNELSHLSSVFTVSLFLYIFEKIRTENDYEARYSSYFLLGMVSGMAIMARTQNGIFWIIPGFFLFKQLLDRFPVQSIFKKSSIFLLGSFIGVLPQLTMWKILNGSWLYAPEASNLNFADPHILETLFSGYHGMFLWTPVLILAVTGLILLTYERFWVGFPLLFAYLLQLGLNSTIIGWWQAASFGMRHFTNCSAIFCVGLTYLYSRINSRWLGLIGWLFVFWTLLLCLNVITTHIDLNVYHPPAEIVEKQVLLLPNLFSGNMTFHEIFPGGFYPLKALILLGGVLLTSFLVLAMKSKIEPVISQSVVSQISPILLCVFLSSTSLLVWFFGYNSHLHTSQYRKELEQVQELSDGYEHYMAWSFHLYNAFYLQAVSKEEKAVTEYRKVLTFRHDLPEAYNSLGVLLIKLQKYQEARDTFQTGLQHNPQNKMLSRNLNKLKIYLGEDIEVTDIN